MKPLQDVAAIRSNIESAEPLFYFVVEPSGLQKIEAAQKKGVTFPDVLMKHFRALPEKLYAVYNSDGLSITIYGFESNPLTRLHAEVRGTPNPIAILRKICEANSWHVTDDATCTKISLDQSIPEQWSEFVRKCEAMKADEVDS